MDIIRNLTLLLKVIKHGDYKNWNSVTKYSDRVIIVGNGPSLSNDILFDLKNKGTQLCCVNSFAAENKEFFNLQPKYYCAIDHDYYAENPMDPVGNKELYKNLNKVNWHMYYICYRNQRLPVNNNFIHMIYLPVTKSNQIPIPGFWYKHGVVAFRFQNVINACLYYFITARVTKIFLIGIETDWHRELFVNENNDVYRKKRHFYGEYLENVTETGIIGKGELYKYFEYYAMTLKCFYLSALYAKYMDVEVINFTLNSYVDCFQKMEYHTWLKEILNER